MKKILMINGSPHENGCTFTALSEVANTLKKLGVDSEIVWVGNKPVSGCIACGKCSASGKCIFDDKVNYVLDKLDSISGIVVGSPVYYGSANGQICSFLDRLFYAGSSKMAGMLGASVVSCRRGGASSAFDRLNKYFTISNMPVVSSQYWNQVHGGKPEEVMKDEEGLQTMRTLAQNIAWLLESIENGKKDGVSYPQYEQRLRTNYIR